MKTIFTNGILCGIFGIIFISLSCKEYDFTSPYDKQNNVSAPAGLQTVFIADTAVSLKWQYSFEQGINYTFDIELSEDGQNYSLLKIIKENIDSTIVQYPFTAEKMYYFRVRSRADNNASAYVASSAKISFPAPSNLQVNFEADTAAVLSWLSTNTMEIQHSIEQSVDDSSYSEIGIAPINQNTFRYSGTFLTGHSYKYRVRGMSKNNKSLYSNEVSKSITFDAPGNVTAQLLADTAAVIQWTDNSTIETGFEIYISTDGGQSELIKEVGKDVTQTTYEGAFLVGHDYVFGVRAKSKNNFTNTAMSNSVRVFFDSPLNVIAELPTDTVAMIQWQDNNTIETGYEIHISIDGGNSELIKDLPTNTTQVSYESDFFVGHTYTFSVRAKSAKNGVSPFTSTSTQFNLMQVSKLTVVIPNNTTANLSWSNGSGYASEIVIEQSLDGINYTFVKNVLPSITSTIISGNYLYNVPYYFRIRTNTINNSGNYSVGLTPGPWICGRDPVSFSGTLYNTVQIGSQCWLKENLNVGTRINGTVNPSYNGTIEKYCYDDNEANCNTYGALYTWNEAMGYSTTAGARGICPEGWHIPTNAEFQTLASSVSNNSNALKTVGQGTGSGAGTNSSGFSALLAGLRSYYGYFANLTNDAYFWSSTEYSSTDARLISLYYYDSSIYFYYYSKGYGFGIRCVKD